MKKICSVLLFLLFFSTCAFAQFDSSPITGVNFKTYVVSNTGAVAKTTYVSTTTFLLSYRIIGFETVANSANATYGSLFDASTSPSSTNVFGEVPVAASLFNFMFFNYPKRITTGLAVEQGRNSDVLIFYVEE
jgi:hypothetical protein